MCVHQTSKEARNHLRVGGSPSHQATALFQRICSVRQLFQVHKYLLGKAVQLKYPRPVYKQWDSLSV